MEFTVYKMPVLTFNDFLFSVFHQHVPVCIFTAACIFPLSNILSPFNLDNKILSICSSVSKIATIIQ